MTKRSPVAPAKTPLRRKAEERIKERDTHDADRAREVNEEPKRLMHELEVHQIELQMQNEELQRARRDLERALKRSTEIFDFAPIGYVVLDPDGTIRELNYTAARLLGAERKRFVGRRIHHSMVERCRVEFVQFLQRTLESHDSHEPSLTCEVLLEAHEREDEHERDRDRENEREDEGRWVLLHGAPLDDNETTALLALEDITERRHAETALREEGRRKDEFLAALSHELRNPLGAISNSLFVLRHAQAGGPDMAMAQDVIGRQSAHLSRIVDDLLDVTRIAQGKLRLQREKLELGGLAQSSIDDHRGTFEALGVALNGPHRTEPLWVDADPTRVAQVLSNLLGNAGKFTPQGGAVDLALWREGATAVVSVSDTGAGISPELRARLFQPFIQGPQTLDRSRGGLGLGLAMVKGLVELHGGSVEIASHGAGRGTQMIVRLPLQAAPQPAKAAGDRAQKAQRRVLLIEDNVDVAQSLRAVLECMGHSVECRSDGASGVERARELHPDLILCDIGLPTMNGYEVAEALRSDKALRSTYLVALSGYALPEDALRATAAGFDTHIPKPPTLERLREVLDKAPMSESPEA